MATNSSTAETARVKGPLVWLDMDQKELDDAYDQTVYYKTNVSFVVQNQIDRGTVATQRNEESLNRRNHEPHSPR